MPQSTDKRDYLPKQAVPLAEAPYPILAEFQKAAFGLLIGFFVVETSFREEFVGVADEFFFESLGHVGLVVVVGQGKGKPLRDDFGAGDAGTSVALADS